MCDVAISHFRWMKKKNGKINTNIPGRWCLNRRCTFSNRWIIFRRNSWCSSFVDGRIVNLWITDHSHEKWTLLFQCLFPLAIQHFGNFVGLLLFQQFGGKIRYYIPSSICEISKRKTKHFNSLKMCCPCAHKSITNIIFGATLSHSAKSYDVFVIDWRRHHV